MPRNAAEEEAARDPAGAARASWSFPFHHAAEMDADPKIRCACLRTLRNGAAEVAVERQIIRPTRFNLPLPAVRPYRQTLAMRDLETWCAQHHPIPGHPPHAGHEHLQKSGL